MTADSDLNSVALVTAEFILYSKVTEYHLTLT